MRNNNPLPMGRPVVRSSKSGQVPVKGSTRRTLITMRDNTGIPMRSLVALAVELLAENSTRDILLMMLSKAKTFKD